jgi:hypothetical protein
MKKYALERAWKEIGLTDVNSLYGSSAHKSPSSRLKTCFPRRPHEITSPSAPRREIIMGIDSADDAGQDVTQTSAA